MKQRIYDISLLIGVALITLVIGFFVGRYTTSGVIHIPDYQQAYEQGQWQHSNLCIDLNKASVDDLQLLPAVDKTLAQNIIDYRKHYGAFVSVNELMYVEGMTKEHFELIKKHVIVGG